MSTGRRRIAILYDYNENWIGVTYYIQNLICALNKISDESKPAITVIAKSQNEFNRLAKSTNYPLLEFKKLTFFERVLNNYVPDIFFKNIIGRHLWKFYARIDLLFPAPNGVSFSFCKNRLFWVADFQEHYLPEFFSVKEIIRRKSVQKRIVRDGQYIVFSSNSAKKDFNSIYPNNDLIQFVVPFAVTHPILPDTSKHEILEKYFIPVDYYICSNQFWKHKNHIVVLKAIHCLKKQGKDTFVVFTGKIHDYRNPDYFGELQELIEKLGIKANVKFLGFISREDQLLLMKNAIGVIQPSLFEGWSTVVEDAKAMNLKIIASDIDVHKEQLISYSSRYFFDPGDEIQLKKCIETANEVLETPAYDYKKDIYNYGNAFSAIMKAILTPAKL